VRLEAEAAQAALAKKLAGHGQLKGKDRRRALLLP
jgi:hypothetical protein